MTDASPNVQYTGEPLIDAKEVASWLKVSEDWVWDHSTRRAPFLPAVWLSSGALKFGRPAIRTFIAERERISSLRRKQRNLFADFPELVPPVTAVKGTSPQLEDFDEPLMDAKDIAAWLKVSEDWVWDHSRRRAPFLPAIWLSNGALRFRRSAIRAFIDERERLSSQRRRRRKQ